MTRPSSEVERHAAFRREADRLLDGGGVAAELARWRSERCRRDDVPVYYVLTLNTLRALAQALPQSREQLLGVPGMTEEKVQAYGADLLAITAPGTEPGDQ